MKAILFIAVFLVMYSCNPKQEQSPLSFAPKVVKAEGYVVPKDSITEPKMIPVGKPRVVRAGKPKVVFANTNVHPAGIPRVVVAGVPKVCTPGQDGFSLPKTVLAIGSPFMAGIPEVVIAGEAYAKEQNPQNFSSFGKLQGLKNANVWDMVQDKNGNLWIATPGDGISKYDGKSFTHFSEKEGLSGNFVNTILLDKSGNLWFGTYAGVSKYDGKRFTNFTVREGLVNINSILEDKSGNLWFGSYGGGLSRYDGRRLTHFTVKEGLGGNYIMKIAEDKKGNLWIATGDGGVSKYYDKSFITFTEKEGLIDKGINTIREDKSGNLWFGTANSGVTKYDSDNKSFTYFTEKEGLLNNNVLSIMEDKTGDLWFGTGRGASKYGDKIFTNFTEQEGLNNYGVWSILEDTTGNIWFGTGGGGVSKYGGRNFTHYTRKEGLAHDAVISILEDKKGNLWFGTTDGGVTRYDGKIFTTFTSKEGLAHNIVWSILEDKDGNLWFGTFKGVSKYDGKNFTNFTEKEGLGHNDVHSILEDKNGHLWFGTAGGVTEYDGKNFTHFTEKQGLNNNLGLCLSIVEDNSGNLWFGTTGGVTKYDSKSKIFTRFTEKEGLGNNTVRNIFKDKSGNLWFGTAGGVSKYDGQRFTHFTEKQGLSSNNIYGAAEDKNGDLWFGTPSGLNKLKKDRLAKGVTKPEPFFKIYTFEDGFAGIGVNEGKTICEAKDGTIWIGANDRLTAFHPGEEMTDTIAPSIQLSGVTLFNENIGWQNLMLPEGGTSRHGLKDTNIVLGNGVKVHDLHFDNVSQWYGVPEHLSLPYNNNYLTFQFVGITLQSPKKVKYQYKLDGVDQNWSALTNRSEATYGNLPYGKYNFKVKAMNGDGYWSKEFNYSFIIRPPWWYTWWAYCLYGLLIAAAVVATHRYQKQRIIRIEQEKAQKKELEHAKEIEKAYNELQSTQAQLIQREKMASLGELTAGIAHEIQNPLNFVNNFSEINKELLVELKDEIDRGNANQVKSLADDVIENQEKINQHGKRADSIVKGMLQHSRSSSGIKEPTDINALADEYLRLSYHGLRAKDKDFNATMKTDFDETIGRINIIPQDIGRVLLNLYNNAFYAVSEKIKTVDENYKPLVSVQTKRINNKPESYGVEIRVVDNGNGIPQKVVDKIFQPFFTTKPTGQGTGLGLSLSYDIIKAHGGEIKVETKEGEGSAFVITLNNT